jgi:hypothetical protein
LLLKILPGVIVYNIYRRSWKDKKTGKIVRDRVYTMRYRLKGDSSWHSKVIGISDKQSAEDEAKTMHLQMEKEAQGLAIPAAELKAATAAVLPEIEAFTVDLIASRRTKDHVSNVKSHLKLLAVACGWRKIRDINAGSFTAWKAKQCHRAPKTVNEYLGSARAFCSWLVNLDKSCFCGLSYTCMSDRIAIDNRLLVIFQNEKALGGVQITPRRKRLKHLFRRNHLIQAVRPSHSYGKHLGFHG